MAQCGELARDAQRDAGAPGRAGRPPHRDDATGAVERSLNLGWAVDRRRQHGTRVGVVVTDDVGGTDGSDKSRGDFLGGRVSRQHVLHAQLSQPALGLLIAGHDQAHDRDACNRKPGKRITVEAA